MINLSNIKIDCYYMTTHYLICATPPNSEEDSTHFYYGVVECKGFDRDNVHTPCLIRVILYNQRREKTSGYAVYYPGIRCIGAPYYILDQDERLVDANKSFFSSQTNYLIRPLFKEEIFRHLSKPKFKKTRKHNDQLKLMNNLVLDEIIENTYFRLEPAYTIPVIETDNDKNLHPNVSENEIELDIFYPKTSRFVEFSVEKKNSIRLPTWGHQHLVPVRIATDCDAKLYSGLAIYDVIKKEVFEFVIHTSKKEFIRLSDKDRLESEGIFINDSNLVYDYMFDKEGLDIKDIKNLFNN